MAAAIIALLLGLLATAVHADVTGVVFVDLDRDSLQGAHEPTLPGVAVSNGEEVVTTDAAGRYQLPDVGPRGLVFVTRPDGFDCERWYSRSGGDFALAPRGEESGFFVHYSDPHVYDHPDEFIAEYELSGPWWAPRFLVAWLTLQRLEKAVVPRFTRDVRSGLSRALAGHRDVEGAGAAAIYLAYFDEFRRPGSKIGDVHGKIERAFGEIAALRPGFAIATGDLVLDAGGSTPETLASWLRLYLGGVATIESTGAAVYNTIGNHELRGIRHPDERDPEYGTGFFEATFGPSYYSFDRAGLHFVALDTHRPDPTDDRPGRWAFNRMRDEVRRWLQADLRAHAGKAIALLNHEPFFSDFTLPFDDALGDENVVSIDPLLREFDVAYTLNGHTHFPGSKRGGGTTHITAGSLTGLGWFLPQEVYPSGYRLVHARAGRLYSVWKEVGSPVVGFVQPAGDPAIYPASSGSIDPRRIVVVAANVRGPFAGVSLTLDGARVPLERWGDYFFGAQFGGRSGTLVLEARDGAGVVQSAQLEIDAGN